MQETWSLTCWSCGHTSPTPIDPATDEMRCDECGMVTAYGSPMPRITMTPHPEDKRFVVSTFTSGTGAAAMDVDIVLARGYATGFALELLSVCEPEAYRALVALMGK